MTSFFLIWGSLFISATLAICLLRFCNHLQGPGFFFFFQLLRTASIVDYAGLSLSPDLSILSSVHSSWASCHVCPAYTFCRGWQCPSGWQSGCTAPPPSAFAQLFIIIRTPLGCSSETLGPLMGNWRHFTFFTAHWLLILFLFFLFNLYVLRALNHSRPFCASLCFSLGNLPKPLAEIQLIGHVLLKNLTPIMWLSAYLPHTSKTSQS